MLENMLHLSLRVKEGNPFYSVMQDNFEKQIGFSKMPKRILSSFSFETN